MSTTTTVSGSTTSPLTPREIEVIELAADGNDNRATARLLLISEDTVKSHLHRAYRKLGARNRAHAVAICFRRGLLTAGRTGR
jgi:DNA-binding CsgD family transcriptional regulator